MWEVVLAELIKNVVVPELAAFIKHKYDTTGQWPTKEELDTQADAIWAANKARGEEFLNRPKREVLGFNDDGM